MAKNPIRKEEIIDKFLVTSMYGTNPRDWPHETVAACKIICTDKDGNELSVFQPVYRNDDDKHAEVKLIEYLENNPLLNNIKSNVKKIEFEVRIYQNYSPCYSCAQTIYDYYKHINGKITITFANFYKTHAYRGNLGACQNIEGLLRLYKQPGVELRLFGVHVGWERFLGMNQFLSLTEDEKNECLDKAESPRRKDRERQDQKVWDEIFRVGDITSGLQNLSI